MKFYNSLGPNPRLVRMFLLEKGMELPTVEVDIMGGENRQSEYLAKYPMGELPCLELDDGSVIGQTVTICEYLEEVQGGKPLIGDTPEARARTRMWIRHIEDRYSNPMANGFRWAEGLAMFKDRRFTAPSAAEDLKAQARHGLQWIDEQLAGRADVTGDGFGLADIVLYVSVDFASGVGQPPDPSLANIQTWLDGVAARESAEASVHPVAKAGGMRA